MIKFLGICILSQREINQILVHEDHWETCWNRILELERTTARLSYEVKSDRNNQMDLWKRIDELTGTDRYGHPKPKDASQ